MSAYVTAHQALGLGVLLRGLSRVPASAVPLVAHAQRLQRLLRGFILTEAPQPVSASLLAKWGVGVTENVVVCAVARRILVDYLTGLSVHRRFAMLSRWAAVVQESSVRATARAAVSCPCRANIRPVHCRCVSQFADVFEHAEINTELSDAASMHAVAVLVLALIALHHPEDVSPGIAKRVLQSLLGMVQSRTSLRVSGHAHNSTNIARGSWVCSLTEVGAQLLASELLGKGMSLWQPHLTPQDLPAILTRLLDLASEPKLDNEAAQRGAGIAKRALQEVPVVRATSTSRQSTKGSRLRVCACVCVCVCACVCARLLRRCLQIWCGPSSKPCSNESCQRACVGWACCFSVPL